VWSSYRKFFFFNFFGYQSVSNLIKGILGKKKFSSLFVIVPFIQIVGRKGTNTKTEEHTSALGRVADP
jgi:hypothetical protein